MTRPAKLTPAMVGALRMAAREPIRYYRGGWYSIGIEAGYDQRDHAFGRKVERGTDEPAGIVGRVEGDPNAAESTVRALTERGLLEIDGDVNQPNIYEWRWTLTDAGRKALEDAK